MNYSTSMVKVNGKWVQMLIISDTQPLTFESNIITQEGDGISTTYYTDGLYKEVEENGVYYYWFILNSKETTIVDNELLNQYEEALNIMGIETEVADDEAV